MEETTVPLTQPENAVLSSPIEPEKEHQNIGLLLVAFLFVAIAGVVGYFLGARGAAIQSELIYTEKDLVNPVATPAATPATATESAQWQTFESEAFNFRFQHPADWEVTDLLPMQAQLADSGMVGMYGIAPLAVKEDSFPLKIYSGKTVAQLIAQQKKMYEEYDNTTTTSEQELEVYGSKGTVLITENAAANVKSAHFYVTNGTYTYVIPIEYSGDETIKKISETFEFIE